MVESEQEEARCIVELRYKSGRLDYKEWKGYPPPTIVLSEFGRGIISRRFVYGGAIEDAEGWTAFRYDEVYVDP